MARFKDENELIAYLKKNAPIPPPAPRGEINILLKRAGLEERSKSSSPAWSWMMGGAFAASFVGVMAFWAGLNLFGTSGLVKEQATTESGWESLSGIAEDSDEEIVFNVGDDFIVLASLQ